MTDVERFKEMLKIRQRIHDEHVGSDPSDDELYHAAMKGMLNSLDDPYSMYLSPDEAALSQQDLAGEYAGIGAQIDFRKNPPVITGLLPDGAAISAGIKKGDKILAVNGIPTEGLTPLKILSMIRGKAGTKIVLKVLHESSENPEVLTLVRKKIHSTPVTYRKIVTEKKTLGYIKIPEFNKPSVEQFTTAVKQAKDDKVAGLIVDLRDNPGGLLSSVRDIACQWINGDGIVSIQRYKGEPDDNLTCKNTTAPPLATLPTVLLTNGHSASASEILAGALQDHGKGVTVGEKTYGKGVGQSVIPLPSGAEIHLTVFEWLTPKGRAIHKKGIEPNTAVVPKAEDAPEDTPDPQIDAALQYLRSK
jgi:carboxyl-terminal processing protease